MRRGLGEKGEGRRNCPASGRARVVERDWTMLWAVTWSAETGVHAQMLAEYVRWASGMVTAGQRPEKVVVGVAVGGARHCPPCR